MSGEHEVEHFICIDGGGIKGVVPTLEIQRLDWRVPNWRAHADGYAGTSIGSIVAAWLALGWDVQGAIDLLQTKAVKIFAKRDIWDWIPLVRYVRAKYAAKNLQAVIDEAFGDLRLKDVPKKLLIPTFYLGDDIRPASVKVFHNFWDDATNPDRNARLADVLPASAAAPLFFESRGNVDPRFPGQFIDGGVVLNNPSAAAVAKILKCIRLSRNGGKTILGELLDLEEAMFTRTYAASGGHLCDLSSHTLDAWADKIGKIRQRISGRRIRVISFSCGANPLHVKGGDWGPRQWIIRNKSPLVNCLFDGQVGSADYLASEMIEAFGGAYHRLDPKLPREVALDDAEMIPDLVAMAKEVDIDATVKWVQKEWVRDAA